MTTSRRRFLAGAALGLAGARALAQDPQLRAEPPAAALPSRPFGATGLRVPILSLGTHPLGTLPDAREAEAVALIRRALDRGLRYLDTAPSYDAHRAERRIRKALEGRDRDGVLIATKSYQMPRAKALAELDASLEALGTDHVDLFQIHAVGDDEDLARKLDPEDGVLAAALAAQRAGKCRFVGVTGHADPAVMARCLDAHPFDAMLVPVNAADPLWLSFVRETLPKASERKVAVIAMKVFAAGRLLAGDPPRATAAECVRFTLSQPVATAVVGCRTIAELDADLAAVEPFVPMPADEQAALTGRFAPHPGNELEWYKKRKG
jgi:aryl-alcohol dehydrogenase-like predicted oxidoreductase